MSAVVAVVGALGLGRAVWDRDKSTTPPAGEAGGRTAWERVLERIGPDGKVDLKTALAAFSVAVGPLPGVPEPVGRRDRIASGTGAIRWIESHRLELTGAQRAAVDAYLAPSGAGSGAVQSVTTAAGSVWVGELNTPTQGPPACSISRLDPTKLTVQATIPTVCAIFGTTDLASVGDDVWFVDPTLAGAPAPGGNLRRINPATNTVAGDVVPLPFADGTLRASATALFYGESGKGQFRVRPGETTLTRIGQPETNAFPAGFPAGDGLWAVVDGQLAFYTTANGPDGTLDLSDADGGILVAADIQSVYLDRTATGRSEALWRRYLDGRVPTRLATANQAQTGFGMQQLIYFDNANTPTFLVSQNAVAKLWIFISRTNANESLLIVQSARLPSP